MCDNMWMTTFRVVLILMILTMILTLSMFPMIPQVKLSTTSTLPLHVLLLLPCNEMRGVNHCRQMVSKAAHKDLVHVRWNDVR